MQEKSFLNNLSALGFPLFRTEEVLDAKATLARLVRSRDMRLWEGFSLVLANSEEKGLFDYNEVKRYLKNTSDKSYLDSLLALSLALYKVFNLKFSWANSLYAFLSVGKKKEYESFLKKLKGNKDLKVAGFSLSTQRLKSTFNNYFNQRKVSLNELLVVKEELGLEYALSQVFSPKQKELFLKKLRREKLTKTEREYFSRVVKKKVLALANPELHRLSQRLLE